MAINYNTIFAQLFFTPAIRRKTWRKIAEQIRYDIGLIQSFTMLKERLIKRKSFSSKALSTVYGQILQYLYEGHSLDEALTPFIPQEESMLIRGGVKSGKLPDALNLCVDLIDARQRIIKNVIEAVSYPCLLFGLFLVLLIVLSVHVVPQLTVLSNPSEWQGGAYVLWCVADFVASIWGIICLFLFLSALIASLFSLPVWTGRLRLYVEDTPPWSFYRLLVGSIWLFTVATLMQGGSQLNQILEDLLNNDKLRPWLAERLMAIKTEYALGKDLGQTLADTGLNFPDADLIEDLQAYSSLPGFDVRLHMMAREWLDEGIERISNGARILNIICLIAMLSLLCGLAMAVVSLQSQLVTNGGI